MQDVDLVVALDADPAVMRYLGPPHTRADVISSELPRLIAHNDRTDRLGYWALFDEAGTDFIGWCAAEPCDPHLHRVEIGYRIRTAHWSKGIATHAARLMIDYAFAAGARQVVATTMAVNTASRRVLEKAGMHHVRTWHGDWAVPVPGAEDGDVDYVLDRSSVPTT